MTPATSTRLSIAAHRDFPSGLLDGAMPNGDSGLLVASGLSDFGGALMAAERDNSEVLLAFTPNVPGRARPAGAQPDVAARDGPRCRHPGPGERLARGGADGRRPRDRDPPGRADGGRSSRPEGRRSRVRGGTTEAATDTRSPLVVVLGPKGGVGKTTVATNLSTTLAQARPADAPDRPRPPVRRRRDRPRRAPRPHDPRPRDGPGTAGRGTAERLRQAAAPTASTSSWHRAALTRPTR